MKERSYESHKYYPEYESGTSAISLKTLTIYVEYWRQKALVRELEALAKQQAEEKKGEDKDAQDAQEAAAKACSDF